jgi:hypothetical protein
MDVISKATEHKFGSFLETQARPLGFWHQVKSALAMTQIKLNLTKKTVKLKGSVYILNAFKNTYYTQIHKLFTTFIIVSSTNSCCPVKST